MYKIRTILLSMLVSLCATSCIYEDDYSYVGQETKLARFIISVGNEQEGTTRITKQTTEVTQAQTTPVFRGMQDMVFIPFRISGNEVTTSDNRISFNLTLPATGSIPQVSANNTISTLNQTSNSQVYQDVTIVQGTNAFLCYGKATGDDNTANGSLDCAGLEDGNVSGITFTPKAIYTPTDPAIAPTEATALTAYLSSIANTTGWSSLTMGKLKLLYDAFTSQLAGSSANVLATLQNLYDAIELEVGIVRDAVMASLKIGDGTDDILHLTTEGKLAWNDNVSFKDYPASIGLPDGAAYMVWNTTDNRFDPIIDGTKDNIGNESLHSGVDFQHYATPAPLYYRTNTKIKVSDESQLEHYQNPALDWGGILAKYNNGDGEITATTKSVALQKPLEYAVARLDAAVKAATATLQDKDGVSTNASDLQLTGILINGQYAVDYQFTPVGTEPYIIYDNTINNPSASNPITLETNREKNDSYIVNHTLVLPSKQDENVIVYLEFQNNSDHDIATWDGTYDSSTTTGTRYGFVPPGCKLYLAGTITLDTSTQHYVFEQDKVTTFIAIISDLKNACNMVPNMDVGLSFTAQVAIKNWDEIASEEHPIYNW